jgi:hypothetical protein
MVEETKGGKVYNRKTFIQKVGRWWSGEQRKVRLDNKNG